MSHKRGPFHEESRELPCLPCRHLAKVDRILTGVYRLGLGRPTGNRSTWDKCKAWFAGSFGVFWKIPRALEFEGLFFFGMKTNKATEVSLKFFWKKNAFGNRILIPIGFGTCSRTWKMLTFWNGRHDFSKAFFLVLSFPENSPQDGMIAMGRKCSDP